MKKHTEEIITNYIETVLQGLDQDSHEYLGEHLTLQGLDRDGKIAQHFDIDQMVDVIEYDGEDACNKFIAEDVLLVECYMTIDGMVKSLGESLKDEEDEARLEMRLSNRGD